MQYALYVVLLLFRLFKRMIHFNLFKLRIVRTRKDFRIEKNIVGHTTGER